MSSIRAFAPRALHCRSRLLATLILATAFSVTAPDVGRAQCTDYSLEPGYVPVPGNVLDIELAGTTLWIANDFPSTHGLIAVDVTDPSTPSLLSVTDLGSKCSGLGVEGSWAYAATDTGVAVVDIAVPTASTVVTSISIPSLRDADVDGTLLFACTQSTLSIYDVTNPLVPVLISTWPAPSPTTLLGVVALKDDPNAMLVRTETQMTSEPHCFIEALWRIDVSDPANPVHVPGGGIQLTFPDDVQSCADEAYFASDGNLIARATRLRYTDQPAGSFYARDLYLTPSHTSVMYGDGIDRRSTRGLAFEGPTDIAWSVEGAGQQPGILSVDISDFTTPALGSFVNVPFLMEHFRVVGNDIIGVTPDREIVGFDRAGFEAPEPISEICGDAFYCSAHDVEMIGTVAWVADRPSHLRTYAVDVSDPLAPSVLGVLVSTGPENYVKTRIATDGTHLWLLADEDLIALDVSNPTAPAFASTTTNTLDDLRGADPDGGYLHCVTRLGYVRFDVSDPLLPVEVKAKALPAFYHDIAVRDGLGYLTSAGGLDVLDLFQNPKIKHSGLGGFPLTEIEIRNDFAYAGAEDGIAVFQLPPIGQTTAAVLVAHVPLGREISQLTLEGDFLYSSENGARLHVLNVSDPTSPQIVGSLLGGAGSLRAASGALWVANGSLMARPLQCDASAVAVAENPALAERVEAAPNPFAGQTRLTFTLSRPGDVRIDIYDVSGRRVSSTNEGRLPAGQHRRSWDGRTDQGDVLPPGVYLSRVETSTGTLVAKLVRVN